MPCVKKLSELIDAVIKFCPNAAFETDNDGQIVIYTGTASSDEDVEKLVCFPMEGEDGDG